MSNAVIQNLTDQRHILDGGLDENGQRRRFTLPPKTTVEAPIPEWVWKNRGLHALKVQGRIQCRNREPDPEPIPPRVVAQDPAVLALTAQVATLTKLVEALLSERKAPAPPPADDLGAPVPGGKAKR